MKKIIKTVRIILVALLSFSFSIVSLAILAAISEKIFDLKKENNASTFIAIASFAISFAFAKKSVSWLEKRISYRDKLRGETKIRKIPLFNHSLQKKIVAEHQARQKQVKDEYQKVVDEKFVELASVLSSKDEWAQKRLELEKFLDGDLENFLTLKRMDRLKFLDSKITEHYHALKRNLDRAVIKNDYGVVVSDQSREAINEFLVSIGYEDTGQGAPVDFILKTVEVQRLRLKLQDFDPESIPTDGLEFETWVADNLSKFGWAAQATKGAGDQGVDVIAEKNGVRVGIQCKLYGSNVGNKAVQEIIAAKIHFNLDKAAVVTNADYTKSAQELAATGNVKLLSHHDIPKFDAIFLA